MSLSPALTEISLAQLRRRRSAKWSQYPDDVLPAWVAEMDFPLAEAVKGALLEAIGADDCGYANPAELGDAFAEFAARRHGWEVDPAAVSPSPDVVGAITSVLEAIAESAARHGAWVLADEIHASLTCRAQSTSLSSPSRMPPPPAGSPSGRPRRRSTSPGCAARRSSPPRRRPPR